MNKILIICVIAALVLISGCTGQNVQRDVNNGLAMTNILASPSQARAGEMVLIDLEVQNVGGTTARDVKVDLYGVQDQWRDAFGNLVDSTLPKEFASMRPPQPDRNIPGDLKMAQWDLMTPNIPQGISPTLPVEARVSYDYNTSGHLKVFAMSEDEFRRKQLQNEATPASEIINSEGPLHLSIPANYQNPVIVDTTSEEQYQIQPFRIEFQNVGTGYPITLEDDGSIRGAGGRIRGTIEIYGPGAEFDNCLGVQGGKLINLDDAEIPARLRETSTGVLPVACSIKIDKTAWAGRPEDSIQFIFNIFYRYYTKQTVSVKVVGV
jgi:hypothetical protein